MNQSLSCPFHNTPVTVSQFDMLDPQARANPHPYYQWLQQQGNVYKAPFEKSFYVVHQYEDVKLVLTNTKLFSSAILPTAQSPFLALMDGESHLRQREVVNKIFQLEHPNFPRQAIEKFIEQQTGRILQKSEKSFDLLQEWATPIPLASLCLVFGIEPTGKTLRQLHEQSIVINRALFVLGGTGPRRQAAPFFYEKLSIAYSLMKNFSKVKRLKKSIGKEGWKQLMQQFLPVKTVYENPRPNFAYMPQALHTLLDLMVLFNDVLHDEDNRAHGTLLLRQAIAEKRLTLTEAIMLCTFILFAGYETSVSLLSNAVAHLACDEVLFKKLKNETSGIELFMEECLRFYTPVGRFLRRANEDVKIGEQVIPKGAVVIVMLGAANVDATRFAEPFSFQATRERNQHLSFGKGIHFCAGAPLARFQAMVALKELTSQASTVKLDETKKLNMVTDRDNGILRLEELWMKMS